MAYYLIQAAYTPEAWAKMVKSPQDRKAAIAPMIEKLGGRLESFWMSFGEYDAHVIRGVPGSKPPIAEHKHTELDFLFVYVLKGWMSFHYHGHGEHRLKAGDCHIIPPGLSHTVTGWSEDVELLEITAPGAYKTTDTVNGVEVASTTT